MPVITISRGTYSGGRDVAEAVAQRLKLPCLSREVLAQAAQDLGITEEALREAMGKPPSFFERFTRRRATYLACVRSALCQHAVGGSFVYHGNAGHLLLSSLPNVLKVRIIAPMTYRLEAAMRRLKLDRKQAEQHIRKVDEQREKWTRFLYNVSWQDPSLYDLVVNLQQMDVAEAAGLVCAASETARLQWTDASRKAVADAALAYFVMAELSKDDRVAGAEVQVTADAGVVSIRGTAKTLSERDTIAELVGRVPGVSEVRCDIGTFSGMQS